MKLKHLLERELATPTSVEYEQEYQDAAGEWQSRFVVVSGDCITEYDPYGTGDSPTWQSFEPQEAYDKETGEQLDLNAFLKSLTPKAYQWIIDQACENAS